MQSHTDEVQQQGIRLNSIDLSHGSLSASCLLEKLEHIFSEHGSCTIHLQGKSASGSTATPDEHNLCCQQTYFKN